MNKFKKFSFSRQFSHKFKCTSRKTQPKKHFSDYEIVKKRSFLDDDFSQETSEEVILGKGALGLVKLVKDIHTCQFFALKIVQTLKFFFF